MTPLPAGVGLGWRPETAWLVHERRRLAFTEVIAETVDPQQPPPALAALVARGLPVVPHGVALNLGGAAPPDRARIRRLAAVARALRAPLVSEHVAFCRAGDLESPHFQPVPYTWTQLAVLVENVKRVAGELDVPLALENVAAPLVWPGDELAEADFLAELLERTGALLLLDAANLHANLVNHGGDLGAYLARLPLERVAYLHAAGGARVGDGTAAMWRDTHAHPIGPGFLGTLETVLAYTGPRPVLLERDSAFPARAALEAELDTLEVAVAAAPRYPLPRAAAAPAPRRALLPVGPELRDALEGRHAGLLFDLLNPGSAPVLEELEDEAGEAGEAGEDKAPWFQPAHLDEARAIIAAKRARPCRTRSRASALSVAHVAD